MKKLLLSVFALAILITSCNKYANDFQALKYQIAALSLKVDGVSALQSQLTSTTAQITALQAAVGSLATSSSVSALSSALGTANTNIGLIQGQLTSLATTGATAASVGALKAQLEAIIADKATSDAATALALAGLKSKLDAAATSAEVATLRTDILDQILASAQTTDAAVIAEIGVLKADIMTAIKDGSDAVNGKIDALQVIIDKANADNKAQIETVLTNLGTLSTTVADNNTVLTASVTGLQLALAAAQRDLTILLNASAMYNDNVNISTDSDVDFYLAKLFQMGIINGNLIVNTDAVTKIADLNKILAAVVAVIGTNDAVQVITSGNHHHNNNAWTITTVAGSGHFVTIEDQIGSSLTATLLTSIRGDYTVTGSDISDPKIDNVGGAVTYEYAGAYESVSLKTVGTNLVLHSDTTTANINFPNVIVGGHVGDGSHSPNGTVAFNSPHTDKIVFGLETGGQIHNLTTTNATWIKIGTAEYDGALAITAWEALTIDLSAATTAASTVTIASGLSATTGSATTVNLSNLTTSGALTVWADSTADVMLHKFDASVMVTIRGPHTLDIPVWLGQPGSDLSAPETKTLTLEKYRWWSVTAPATIPTTPELAEIETLTLGNALENVNIGTYPTLKKVVLTGAAFGDATHWATISGAHVPGVSTTGNAKLEWLQLGGIMNAVSVSNLPKLTAVATSGIINTMILDNADALLSVTLGHSNFEGAVGYGGPGSDLWITGNAKLASVTTTGLDKMHSLKIVNNALLTSLDLHSYVNPLNTVGFAASLWVFNNKLSGTFSPALAEFGTTAYQEAKITCATLEGLRDYVAVLDNAHATYDNFQVDVDLSTLVDNPLTGETVGTAYKLSVEMGLNAAVSTVIDGITGISNNDEFQLVQ